MNMFHFSYKQYKSGFDLDKDKTVVCYCPNIQSRKKTFALSSVSYGKICPKLYFQLILRQPPTPPMFDDGTATEYPSTEVVDWNGFRNNNEIRFWADYIDPNKYEYIYDDSEWDEADGDGTLDPILPLLDSEYTDVSVTPESAGADEQVAPDRENRSTKIARLDTALE
ncbi:hypothetical protein ACHAWO_007103 [Cyclotella atomus]|uniref:Uncharacterized protein n=1 Tax=Cyclotella atomus TaxID=382360 RepID=A0ABD3QKG7_9STRA